MITITTVKAPHGWLGNMSDYPILYEGKKYKTAEALFQALRFSDLEVREIIRLKGNPMQAKWAARAHEEEMVVARCSEQDLENMRFVLRLKVQQHPGLGATLLRTGEEEIVEDCSNRKGGSGMFWGMALVEGQWEGENWLGRLWMELRAELRSAQAGSGAKAA